MKTIIKLGGGIYLSGMYEMRERESNYAYPCDFPTVFQAKGKGIRSGNWLTV